MTLVKNDLYCSFCGKSQSKVFKLIAGPTVFICDDCVSLCTVIISEERAVNRLREIEKEQGYVKILKSDLKRHGIVWPPRYTSLQKFERFLAGNQ